MANRNKHKPSYPLFKFEIDARPIIGMCRKKSIPANINNTDHNIFQLDRKTHDDFKHTLNTQPKIPPPIARTKSQGSLQIPISFHKNQTSPEHPLRLATVIATTAIDRSSKKPEIIEKGKLNKSSYNWYDSSNPRVGLNISATNIEARREKEREAKREMMREKVIQCVKNNNKELNIKKYGNAPIECTQMNR